MGSINNWSGWMPQILCNDDFECNYIKYYNWLIRNNHFYSLLFTFIVTLIKHFIIFCCAFQRHFRSNCQIIPYESPSNITFIKTSGTKTQINHNDNHSNKMRWSTLTQILSIYILILDSKGKLNRVPLSVGSICKQLEQLIFFSLNVCSFFSQCLHQMDERMQLKRHSIHLWILLVY